MSRSLLFLVVLALLVSAALSERHELRRRFGLAGGDTGKDTGKDNGKASDNSDSKNSDDNDSDDKESDDGNDSDEGKDDNDNDNDGDDGGNPVDCCVSQWATWQSCSCTCGTGSRIRIRMVTVQPSGGGAACPPLTDSQPCSGPPCGVNCQVSQWTTWGGCSKTCGRGQQVRSRMITVSPSGSGTACPPLTDTIDCNTQSCGVDCCVSEWTTWGMCSKTCGTGQKMRSRHVTIPNSGGGAACPPLTDTVPCNTQSCAVDCCVSEWTTWGPCSKTCGTGQQQRSRHVTIPASGGGAACPLLTDTINCNTQSCAVDCCVSEWTTWGTCSKTCGTGQKQRSRHVTIPASGGGAACPPLTDTVPCNTQSCGVDCCVSEWTTWGSCSKSCGTGQKERSRHVTIPSSGGGAACPPLTDYVPCNTQSCPVDCCVSEWTTWGSCSKSCGTGQKMRSRHVVTPNSGGGAACPPLTDYVPCNTQSCGVDCCVSEWTVWGPCSKTCGTGQEMRSRHVTIPASGGGAACPTLSDSISCNTQRCGY